MSVRSSPHRQFALAVAGQFLLGAILALPGTLFGVPDWTRSLGFDVASQGRLLVCFFAGQFLFTAPAGALIDRLGARAVLAGGGALIAAALALLGTAADTGTAYAAALVLATGGSAINAGTNTLVSAAFGARRAPMLSLAATFGAAGAVSAPLLFRGSPDASGVTLRLWSLAAAAAVVAVLPAAVPSDGVAPAAREPMSKSLALLRERRLAGLIVLLSLQFGTEAVLAGWTAAYTIAVVPGASGALMVGLYWGGLCISRAAAPLILARVPKLIVVLAGALLVAASVTGLALAESAARLAAAAFAAGIGVGPLSPTIVAVTADRYPGRIGSVLGLLLSVAQVGAVVLPWLTARATIAAGYRGGLLVPILSALAIAAGAALVWRGRHVAHASSSRSSTMRSNVTSSSSRGE
ncbi:MAG TPA: MFS transporter [Vicinamibacterales bacterium]